LENWVQQRETYRTKLELKRLEKKSGLLASESTEFDFKALESKQSILQVSHRVIQKSLRLKRAKQ